MTRYRLHNFTLLKVLGKGSFGKVGNWHPLCTQYKLIYR